MLSKNRLKYISSLGVNKYRKKYGVFIVEGHKMVIEAINSPFNIEEIYALGSWISEYGHLTPASLQLNEVSEQEMKKISVLSSVSGVLAVVKMANLSVDTNIASNQLVLALDDIRDPGNLGTIIRTADWFGIKEVICSSQTVDCYNPKVVQATMGSIFRVNVSYIDLEKYINTIPETVPVYGSFLDGENILETKLSESGIIIIGNEARGISAELEKLVTNKILIPSFNDFTEEKSSTAESLNASIATSIVCFEFRRRMKNKK